VQRGGNKDHLRMCKREKVKTEKEKIYPPLCTFVCSLVTQDVALYILGEDGGYNFNADSTVCHANTNVLAVVR